jgi:NAD(P)-dependent dehydrogenase (short-subunit alcohol dehydrogenase family)
MSVNPFTLEGKSVLVTGASSGIGRSVAIETSKLGARVLLSGRNELELHNTLKEMHGDGHEIITQELAQGEVLVSWVKELAARLGPLHGLVHCAGISVTMPLKATTGELYERILSINLNTAYWLLKGFRQRGVHAEPASVVFLASVSGVVGTSGLSAYCASKGGLISLAKSAALELVSDKIRVNVISPAWVQTSMVAEAFKSLPEPNKQSILANHPLGIGEPEDVALAAVYLLSDAAKWVTGANFAIDGGYTAR